jgi:hypothetical protein
VGSRKRHPCGVATSARMGAELLKRSSLYQPQYIGVEERGKTYILLVFPIWSG